MTIGVGGSTAEKELAAMTSMRGDVPPIGVEERLKRVARAQAIMREKGIDALYLDVSSSMVYFTGLNFRRTERMHSAVLPAKGDIVYVSPAFEVEKLKTMTSFGDKIAAWEEDEDPDRRRHRDGTLARLSERRDRGRRGNAVLHLRRAAPRRQQLHVRQRGRCHGRLPHDQVRARDRVDADRKEHHACRTQGSGTHHARRHHDNRGAGLSGRRAQKARLRGAAAVQRRSVR